MTTRVAGRGRPRQSGHNPAGNGDHKSDGTESGLRPSGCQCTASQVQDVARVALR